MTDDARVAYEAWHARLEVDAQADAPWHRLVRSYLLAVSGQRVLEIGCGRGGFSAWLATQGPALAVGADFSRTAVTKAAAFAAPSGLTNLRFELADIQRLGHPDATFDIVISCETIEHVSDPRRAVAELARVLVRGGRLYLTTPNYLGLMGLYRGYRRLLGRPYTEEGQPVNHFVILPRTRAWVRAAGLEITATDGVGHYLPVPGRPPIAIHALDRPRAVTRWIALHSLVVARKP